MAQIKLVKGDIVANSYLKYQQVAEFESPGLMDHSRLHYINPKLFMVRLDYFKVKQYDVKSQLFFIENDTLKLLGEIGFIEVLAYDSIKVQGTLLIANFFYSIQIYSLEQGDNFLKQLYTNKYDYEISIFDIFDSKSVILHIPDIHEFRKLTFVNSDSKFEESQYNIKIYDNQYNFVQHCRLKQKHFYLLLFESSDISICKIKFYKDALKIKVKKHFTCNKQMSTIFQENEIMNYCFNKGRDNHFKKLSNLTISSDFKGCLSYKMYVSVKRYPYLIRRQENEILNQMNKEVLSFRERLDYFDLGTDMFLKQQIVFPLSRAYQISNLLGIQDCGNDQDIEIYKIELLL